MAIPAGSLTEIIKIAQQEVGTIEGPKDNETKYGAWMKVNFQPWCQSFVSWCAYTAGLDQKKYPKTASTVAAAEFFKKNNRWADARNDDPTPGDWIYFDFPDDGVNRISHVGICIKNNGDGTIQVIEGNTSGTAKGDQRNGGMCVEKTRGYVKDNKKKLVNAVVGWGRPVYSGEEDLPLLSKVGSTDKALAKEDTSLTFINFGLKSQDIRVKKVQEAFNLKVDGVFGKNTESSVKNFQSKNNLIVTGTVDFKTWNKIIGQMEK